MTAAERAQVLELARKLHVEPDMVLPAGKTCADCRHCDRCVKFGFTRPENPYCDFSPHRYAEAIKEEAERG